ncbi:MAG: class I SAM-dependent methyltransferase [Planctomycetota bacterium]
MARKDWYEQDVFWKTFEPYMFNEKLERTPKEIDAIISLLELKRGACVLDLCCGPGRHSLELARRGFRVTGVDRTAAYLQKARRKAKGLRIEFVRADMREFCRPKAFNAVINMFTSFGYFKDQVDDYKVAKNVYESLKPGGVFMLELMGKEILSRIFQERDWHEEKDGTILLQERKLNDSWGWTDNKWIIIKGAKRIESNVSHRLYSAVELRRLLTDCGFRKVKAYGSLEGVPYDHKAQRLVVIAYK